MTDLIDKLNDASEIKQLTGAELEALAGELRTRIIETVSTNGGHLASNLGTVELTLALLRQFDSVTDRVVWDVGHQSYSWKLLTGRAKAFRTLRQEGGLSGFPKREESPADAFDTGHSSTSISAALGIARGLKAQGKPGQAIAVIGDGALTAGLAYEALNNTEPTDNLIVIINDNQMSIDSNVGSLARHLGHVRVDRRYLRAKSGVERMLAYVPLIGEPLTRLMRWAKTQIRRATSKKQSFFETLGYEYYGPIDGHNLEELQRYLKVISEIEGPVILHVLTQKGRGYKPAENLPSLYHGVAPFEIDLGVIQRAKSGTAVFPANCQSFTAAFTESLMELASRDSSIVAITAAMAAGTGLSSFSERYPDRFYDVGIAEQHAVTLAAGLATTGMKPVVAMYASFLQRALDQVMHDVVLQQLPVVLCIDRAGIVGDDGETHQGLYDLSFLTAMPGLTVLMPSDYRNLYEMLRYALQDCSGPVVIRYPRGAATVDTSLCHGARELLPLPKARVVRTGGELVIAALGSMTAVALEAADLLQEDGILATVIDVRAIKPLDSERILAEAMDSGQLITIEEVSVSGGLAQQLALRIAELGLEIELSAHYVGDHPVLQAPQARAREIEGLSAPDIVHSIQKHAIRVHNRVQ